MTANELYEMTIKLTVQLRQAGIKQGDIVTVNIRNVPNSTMVMLALFCVGAVINILDHNNLTNPSKFQKYRVPFWSKISMILKLQRTTTDS